MRIARVKNKVLGQANCYVHDRLAAFVVEEDSWTYATLRSCLEELTKQLDSENNTNENLPLKVPER